MSHPIFSIIVPVYNAEDTIVHTIEVLKNLAFEEYEVILVNDGSTDKTEQLIQSAIQGDSHFQLLQPKIKDLDLLEMKASSNLQGNMYYFSMQTMSQSKKFWQIISSCLNSILKQICLSVLLHSAR